MGSTIIAPSTDNANPAPRDSHTENVKVFSPASRWSVACFHLFRLSATRIHADQQNVPSVSKKANMQAMEHDIKDDLAGSTLLAQP